MMLMTADDEGSGLPLTAGCTDFWIGHADLRVRREGHDDFTVFGLWTLYSRASG